MKRRAMNAVTVALDRDRRLTYDLNAICAFEEVTGQSVISALRNLSMTNIRALLWAGLRADDPEITLEQTGALIGFTDLTEVTAALKQALRTDSATDDVQPDAGGRPTQPAATEGGASIGAVSGLSDGSISDLQTANSGN